MRQAARCLCVLFLLCLAFFYVPKTYAESNSFITIVNPVRISSYTKDPLLSLQSEYGQVKSHNLPATWLLTYDVLNNKNLMSEFKQMDDTQEKGIFLEVTPRFAQDSSVIYNKTNSWHRANSLFLSGYMQQDRIKLIDTVFSKFKKQFGYYPKSVGAWWVDSYSLSYMKQKYGITGSLGVSDQYDLDGYQVWGTPYSSVYIPNKFNSAIPAGNDENKIDTVMFRWAERDPLNGYLSPSKSQASLYSLQDYMRQGLDINYYQKMVDLYSSPGLNDFGQVTVGLEADYSPDSYNENFAKWMELIDSERSSGKIIDTMSSFSSWYLNNHKDESAPRVIQTDDLLESTKNITWNNNNLYRIGILAGTEDAKVIDFRIYPANFVEPYYYSPNKEYNLSINLPYIIDSVITPKSVWDLYSGKLVNLTKSQKGIELTFEKGKLVLSKDSIVVTGLSISKKLKDSQMLTFSSHKNNTTIELNHNYPIGPQGVTFSSFFPHVPFALKHRLERYKVLVWPVLFVILVIFLWLLFKNRKILLFCFIVLLLFASFYCLFQVGNKYYVSQTEMDALSVLAKFDKGKVLVYDKDCLRCIFVTKYKPAAAAGIKSYISKYSDQETVLDYEFQTAPTSQTARQVLSREGIKYIYLPRYENYIESLPYIPKDLGLKRIYENANAQIWEVL